MGGVPIEGLSEQESASGSAVGNCKASVGPGIWTLRSRRRSLAEIWRVLEAEVSSLAICESFSCCPLSASSAPES